MLFRSNDSGHGNILAFVRMVDPHPSQAVRKPKQSSQAGEKNYDQRAVHVRLIPIDKQQPVVALAQSANSIALRPYPDHGGLAIGFALDPVASHREFHRTA